MKFFDLPGYVEVYVVFYDALRGPILRQKTFFDHDYFFVVIVAALSAL
jgi:hypothetical protein